MLYYKTRRYILFCQEVNGFIIINIYLFSRYINSTEFTDLESFVVQKKLQKP